MSLALSDEQLIEKAKWVREQTFRIHKLAPETRVASSLSPVEIFTAMYFGGVVAFDPQRPLWENRDRVVISKGHGSLCMYPILADLNFFPREELNNVCKEGSFLGGIPDPIIPGYETVNGSLGHGLGVACGMALSLLRQKKPQSVFAILGDGEMHEGSIWEALLFAPHHQLENLTVIVDRNKYCMLNETNKVINVSPIEEKMKAFGFHVEVIGDGHNVTECRKVLELAARLRNGKPKFVVAETLKGKGAAKLEKNPMCHVTSLSAAEVDAILAGGSL